jgi:hypothetical protein
MLKSLASLGPRPVQSIVEFCRAILFPPANGTLTKSCHSPRPKPLFFRTSGCKTTSLDNQLHCSFSSFRTGHRLAASNLIASIVASIVHTLEAFHPCLAPGPRVDATHAGARRAPAVRSKSTSSSLPIRLIPLLTTQPSNPSPN